MGLRLDSLREVALGLCALACAGLVLPGAVAGQEPQDVSPALSPEEPKPPGALVRDVEVAGIIGAPGRSVALIVILDDEGKEAGSRWVGQGDTVEGYRVVAVEPDRVSFERDGEVIVRPLGHGAGRGIETVVPGERASPGMRFIPAGSGPLLVPDVPYPGQAERTPGAASSAARPEVIRATEALLERVVEDPAFQKELEEVRGIIRRRLSRPGTGSDGSEADPGFPDRPAEAE